MEPGLGVRRSTTRRTSRGHPAHAAVVEVDTETGDTRLVRYVACDDVGTVVNPSVVDGQVHGGITQGIAAALYEEGTYDEDGNLQTANVVTYLVPSSAELPSFELERTETPTPDESPRCEGRRRDWDDRCGPGGDQRSARCLSHLGVKDIQMPATPERVWRAIQEAQA